MIEKFGDMFDHIGSYDYVLVTTNSFVKRQGELVMGRGAAKQARDMFPGIDKYYGEHIERINAHLKSYYLLFPTSAEHNIGLFQVKYHWRDAADLALIAASAKKMAEVAEHSFRLTFAINYPGIGNGGLAYDDVNPLLQDMPDNIHIWRFNNDKNYT